MYTVAKRTWSYLVLRQSEYCMRKGWSGLSFSQKKATSDDSSAWYHHFRVQLILFILVSEFLTWFNCKVTPSRLSLAFVVLSACRIRLRWSRPRPRSAPTCSVLWPTHWTKIDGFCITTSVQFHSIILIWAQPVNMSLGRGPKRGSSSSCSAGMHASKMAQDCCVSGR